MKQPRWVNGSGATGRAPAAGRSRRLRLAVLLAGALAATSAVAGGCPAPEEVTNVVTHLAVGFHWTKDNARYIHTNDGRGYLEALIGDRRICADLNYAAGPGRFLGDWVDGRLLTPRQAATIPGLDGGRTYVEMFIGPLTPESQPELVEEKAGEYPPRYEKGVRGSHMTERGMVVGAPGLAEVYPPNHAGAVVFSADGAVRVPQGSLWAAECVLVGWDKCTTRKFVVGPVVVWYRFRASLLPEWRPMYETVLNLIASSEDKQA